MGNTPKFRRILWGLSAVTLVLALSSCSLFRNKSTDDSATDDQVATVDEAINDSGAPPSSELTPDQEAGAVAGPESAGNDAPAVDQMPPEGLPAEPQVSQAPDMMRTAEPTSETAKAPEPETPAPTMASGSADSEYRVKRGDTLMKISYELYGDFSKWRDIYALNESAIKDPMRLPKGLRLKYDSTLARAAPSPRGDPYVIKTGDTLGTIASDVYGTPSKWRKLWDNNRDLVKDPNRIFAGFTLYYLITENERAEAQQMKQSRLPASQKADLQSVSPKVFGPVPATK